ncbi:hypothetical protein [Micromonospora chersina]|uniref:hypothetical protein n=1 Tax=Micromonospora chersina TaxID=47854 RepID=UPI00371EAD2F
MTNTARRWLLAGAFTAAGIAGAAAYDAATHQAHAADTKPGIVAEQGGLPCHDLPRQASARAKAVVAKVAAEPAKDEPAEEPATPPPAKPEPKPEPTAPAAPDPEPEPTVEPTPTTEPEPTPGEPIVDVPPVAVPPVVVDTPPVVIDPTPATPTPVPEPVVVTLPADDPAPLPDADAPVTAPKPQPVGTPTPPAPPVQLPVVIGPIPTADEPPAAATVGELRGATAVLQDAPDCDADALDAIHVDRDLIGQLIDSLTAPAAQPQVKAKPGCPDKPKPAPDQPACTGTTTTSSNAGGNGAPMYADTTTGIAQPALMRLEHARARSTIPASRHVAIEPGPA